MIRRLARLAIACFWLTACATSNTVPAHLLDDCSDSYILSACFPTQMFFVNEEARERHASKQGASLYAARGNRAQTVALNGRLNGGPVAPKQFVSWAFERPCDSDGDVAYRGQSNDDNPVVETEIGLFEIADKDINVGYGGGRILIDAETGSTIAQFTEPADGEGRFKFVSATEVYLEIRDLGLCLTAPGPGRGLMRLAPGMCAGLPKSPTGKIVESDWGLDVPSSEELAVATRALPDDASYWKEIWPLKVGRIRGTRTIVVAPHAVCT